MASFIISHAYYSLYILHLLIFTICQVKAKNILNIPHIKIKKKPNTKTISMDLTVPKTAKKILENDHYGLEDVKKRILEFLAVRKLKK